MSGPRIGSLTSGVGGLDLAVLSVLGGHVVWHAEIDPAGCKVLAARWPGVPNLGDVSVIDWDAVPRVDVLTAGYPCQPFSLAGRRAGGEDARHLWPCVADALGALRPRLFVGENVRGHLSLGFDQVIRDLDLLNYDVHWVLMRAADIGAPHGRARLFMIGVDGCASQLRGRTGRRGRNDRGDAHQSGGYLRDPGGGGNGHQGVTDPLDLEDHVWRPIEPDEAGDRSQRSEDAVGHRGRPSAPVPIGDIAAPHSEGRAGCDLHGAARQDPSEQGRAGSQPLDRGLAPARGDRETADSRPERQGPGDGAAESACGPAGSDTAVGCLVGAGRRVVRADRVHGPHPCVRADGGRAHLQAPGLGARSLAWPAAHAADLGCGAARRDDGLRATGLVPVAVADPASNGRGEGRPEPARLVRRPDAALGGSATPADPTGVGRERVRRARNGRAGPTDGGESPADADGQGREWAAALAEARCSPPGPSSPVARPGGCSGSAPDADRAGRWSGFGLDGSGEAPPVGDRASSPAHTCGDAVGERPVVEPEGSSKAVAGLNRAPTAIGDGYSAGVRWGAYGVAIRRWELISGRSAPSPTTTGKRGGQQLSATFVEWMQGLPQGWVTDVPGVSRNEALRLLGGMVVPQQGAAALRELLDRAELVTPQGDVA